MCKSKMKTDATEPRARSSHTPSSGSYNYSSSAAGSATNPRALEAQRFRKPSSTSSDPSLEYESYNTTGSDKRSSFVSGSTSSVSSSRLRNSLPGNSYVIYDFSEISKATNNFLAKRIASSSSAWRCSLRGKEVIVFQRKFRRLIDTSELHERLSLICKSHHMSLIKLVGASISGGGGDHIYLVYDFVSGANLADCLRNARNPGFTVLSSWISRMQIAIDLAQGLEYIHHYIGQGQVHNHIKSSSLIITEPSFNAKICHFGTAQLCGEIETYDQHQPKLKRSDSRTMKFQGTRGYMSPEYQSGGSATQKSDVFAFGVLILELLSGEEPLKYIFNKHTGDYRRLSVIQTANQALDSDQQLRRWMDTRLNDSFPVEVAEKMLRLALDCVHPHPDERPDMRHVAGKLSKLYIMSTQWADRIKPPTGISLSLGPR